jgi:SAM-dependent methyltransferase
MSDLAFKKGGPPLMRRVQGYHDLRLDGLSDLLHRARGVSVFDIGCNRGLAGFEFANNGAELVHGCDIYEDGLIAARHLFCDLRTVEHRFEVVDLTGGPEAVQTAFGGMVKYDIVLLLATYHKLRRISGFNPVPLLEYFGQQTKRYLAWRGHAEELPELDQAFSRAGLKRIHTSFISDIQPAAIWARPS